MNLHSFVLFFALLKVKEAFPATCQPVLIAEVSVGLFYAEYRGCTDSGLNSELSWKPFHDKHGSCFLHVFYTIPLILLRFSCCFLAPPPLPTNSPTPSREPWEAESHHHGDLNTDPPHTGPLWLACVEVRGNKMSQQQVFLCFCFCLNSQWDYAQIHALTYTGGTAGETVGVRETRWLEKRTELHESRL